MLVVPLATALQLASSTVRDIEVGLNAIEPDVRELVSLTHMLLFYVGNVADALTAERSQSDQNGGGR
jgi:hypothetical protein